MPVWNAEETIRESIQSVLAQDFTDFELIISDNGSTDSTPDIITEYAEDDSRVRPVLNPENRGGAANFSGLVSLARAPYFKWQSGDDLIQPSYLSRCLEVLDRSPDVVLAYGKTTMIAEDGSFWRHHDDLLHMRQKKPWGRLAHFARYRWLCNAQFGVIRTEVLRQTSLLQPRVSADITMLAELALRGQFHEIPERLFLRRIAARSAGLGELSADERAQWFDPHRMSPTIPPDARVWWDVQLAILRAPIPKSHRLLTLLAYDAARARRQVGIVRYRRRLRRAGEPFPSWESLREPDPADSRLRVTGSESG
jgi:hypothetical protein